MKHFKKILTLLLAAAMLIPAASLAVGAAEPSADVQADVTVKAGGETVEFPDQKPVIRDNRTLVPVRFIAEALGYNVDWDPAEHTAVIDNGRILLYIGTDRAVIDGEPVTLDTASVLIHDRTMIPLRIVAETLGCTVDWFETNRTVLVNERNRGGSEMSVFDRYKQSGLFWNYRTENNEYLVWKDDYDSADDARNAEFLDWWIERPLDRSELDNRSFDCAVIAKTFDSERLGQLRDMMFTPYPVRYADAVEIMMQTVKGKIWETFYEESSELYPLFSAMPASSGTFGSRYYDNRQVEMYMNSTGTQLTVNISAEGYENPEIPRTLTQDEADFYTAQAKQNYCLELWDLD